MKQLFIFLILLFLAVVVGCRDSSRAARKAMSRLEERVDIEKVQQWAVSIVNSDNPSEAFRECGKSIPLDFVKDQSKETPVVRLTQFTNGEWFILFDAQRGLETYGIAIGRKNGQLPVDYKVQEMKPGIFYYFLAQ